MRSQWTQAAEDIFGDLDSAESLWEGVRAQLAVLVFRHGSSTAALLSDNASLQPSVDGLQSEILQAASKQCDTYGQEIVLASLTCFLNLDTPESTEFIEHLLNSAFSYSALSIAPEAAQFLSEKLKRLDIFLDTNFIFGLLEWHESPQNQVSQELLRIAKENKLPFKFYFFEDTLRELKDWLNSQANTWLSESSTPGVSRAMSTTEGIPLIVRKYHEENASEPLNVEMYLERYLNIAANLEALGLTIYRESEQNAEDISVWGERVADYDEFLKSRTKRKERSDASLRHDAILLGIVDRRHIVSESPLTSHCILLTIDSHLIAFSRLKASQKGERPFALYPSQLMQLIMPFIVHTERSARVLADSINIAVFQTIQFDRQRAIAAVSKYIRNIKNLSEPDAKRILSDQILLSQLSLSSDDRAAELVESALATQMQEARKKQSEAEAELEKIRAEKAVEIEDARKRQLEAEAEIERMRLEKENLAGRLMSNDTHSSELEQQLAREASDKSKLSSKVESLEQKIQSLEESRASSNAKMKRRNELLLAVLYLVMCVCIWWVPMAKLPFLKAHANILQIQIAFSIAFLLMALGQFFPKIRNWVWGVVFADILFGIVFAVAAK